MRCRLSTWSLRLLLAGLLSVVGGQSFVTAAVAANPVVTENQQPGTTQWQITKVGTDAVGQIKGYASATSVNRGGNITFHVSVNPAQTYTIDVYRIGWYQGLGGRLLQHIGPLAGTTQPTCPTDPTTGMIACNWASAYTLAAQTSWTSGIYLALLTNAQGYQNYIEFVVRDDGRVAALLYQQPVTTYEAYNDYPDDGTTGKSLYAFNSSGPNTVGGTRAAVKASFDRPYADAGTGAGGQSFLTWEINLVRWMERSGYDVTYSTDVDTDLNGGRLLNYRGFLSGGHDEYWSKAMFDAADAARNAGVDLGFFGGDDIGWQIRFESSSTGVPDRVIVCYRNASIDPTTVPSLVTVGWSSWPEPFRPPQELMGIQYAAQLQNNAYVPYIVTNSGNWLYAGTGFHDGDSVPGIVGYEADRFWSGFTQPSVVSGTYVLLSQSPFIDTGTGAADHSNSSIYQAPSGAWVFSVGTDGWNWALDNYGGRNRVDSRIQQTTANVLNRFVGQHGTNATTTSVVAPASGTSGQAIAASSIGSTLAGAGSGAGGTITFTVFGPQATAPSSCTSGGTNVGTATVSGNGTYHPSAGFTPASAGTYWWYAGYGGDANNTASNSGCGSSMAHTTITPRAATFGTTSVGSNTDQFGVDRKRVNRYLLSQSGMVTKLSMYLEPTSNTGTQLIEGVIYADSGGTPGALIAVSNQLSFPNTGAAGWYGLTFPTPPSLAAGNYWIGVLTGGTLHAAQFRYTSVTNSRDYNTNAYSSGPSNPFGAVQVIDSEQMSLYATYTPS